MTQKPDTKPGNYYVTAMRDDGKVVCLAGPFKNDHAAALATVDRARSVACDVDPRAHWYAYGTARLDLDYPAPAAKLEGLL